MKTFTLRKEDVQRDWYVVDAEGKVLGRVASQVAKILNGKHKPQYTPYVDCGDNVIVINIDKVVLTGKKLEQKYYRTHSQYPGGLKETLYKDLMKNKPELAMEIAVKRMLPKNKLASKMIRRLKVYSGTEHQHSAQNPKVLEV